MPDSPFCEETFPNIQSKLPLVQLEAISCCPIASYLGEETNTPSPQPPFRLLSPVKCRFICLQQLLSFEASANEWCCGDSFQKNNGITFYLTLEFSNALAISPLLCLRLAFQNSEWLVIIPINEL